MLMQRLQQTPKLVVSKLSKHHLLALYHCGWWGSRSTGHSTACSGTPAHLTRMAGGTGDPAGSDATRAQPGARVPHPPQSEPRHLASMTLSAGLVRAPRPAAVAGRRAAVRPAAAAATTALTAGTTAALAPLRGASTARASNAALPVVQPAAQQRSRRSWRTPLLVAGACLLPVARAAAHKLPALLSRRAGRAPSADRNAVPTLLPRAAGPSAPSAAGAAGGRKPALLWFRADLRLHDHEPLAAAVAAATSVLPVYIFDPREYGRSPSGFDKTGPYRARFILDALADLRASLRAAGSDLLVRIGHPEQVLPSLAAAVGAGAVYCHAEVAAEDSAVEAAVASSLDEAGVKLKVLWGGTLVHVDDLPFKLVRMPQHYSDFRDALCGRAVRSPLPAPTQLKGLPVGAPEPGELPGLRQLGFDAATLQRCAADGHAAGAHLRGGEHEALLRLQSFVQRVGGAAAAAAANTRTTNGGKSGTATAAAAPTFCCKISPWLALGCLSPRELYAQLQRGGAEHAAAAAATTTTRPLAVTGAGGDAGSQWLLFELLWRDFFRFITKKHAITAGDGARQQAPAAPALSPC